MKDKPLLHRAASFILAIQLLCLLGFGFKALYLDYDNRIDSFAVKNRESERAFQLLQETFGNREVFLVVLRLRVTRMAEAVSLGERVFEEVAAVPGILRVTSLGSLFPADPPPDAAGLPFPFYDPAQGLYTGIFEIVPDLAREQTIDAVWSMVPQIETRYGEAVTEIVVAGEPIVNHHLNRSSREVRNRFFPLLIGLALILLGFFFRSVKVLLVAALSVGTSLATVMGLMALAGVSMNMVTTLIPTLIFVLAVAMQVHLLVSVAGHGCLQRGVIEKLRPNLLVSLTTSIGFGSLMTSEVAPIATMGFYMALGIWIIFIWTHLTHLGLATLMNLKPQAPRLPWLAGLADSPRYARLIRTRQFIALPVFAILLGGYLLFTNPKESNGLMYFPESHPIREATAYLETHVTGASQLELLLKRRSQTPPALTYLPEEGPLAELEVSLASLPRVRHLLSLRRFIDSAGGVVSHPGISEAALGMLLQWRPELLEPFLSKDYYRIQLLVDSLDRDHYLVLKKQIREQAAAVGFDADLIVTGTLDRVIEIQGYLLGSLSLSLGLTVAAIAVLLLILLGRERSLWAVLIPNLFPLACMASGMWVFCIKTTISTVMVFSIAFGIAVDNTIHLVHACHKRRDLGLAAAWRSTLKQDARAICLTVVALTLGFLVLTVSSFLPTREFGFLLGLGMVFAFVGNLAFLPMLLHGSDSGSGSD